MAGGASTGPSGETGGRSSNAFVQFYRYVMGIGHERNVGGTERAFRYTFGALFALAGLGILPFPVLGSPLSNAVLALVLLVGGLYLIYEAQVQYCPLNRTIGRSTYTEE